MALRKSLAVLFITAVVATGCSTKKAPDCSETATTDLVIQIASKEVESSFNSSKELFENLANSFGGQLEGDSTAINYSVETIRVSEENSETGSYSCRANLVAKAHGASSEVPIAYTSELANDGDDFYVEVYGLTQEVQGELISVLIVF